MKEKEKAEPTGQICPECGGELLKRKSRFGTYFLGCGNYPKCHYMATLDGEKIVPKAKAAKKETAATKKTDKKTTTKKTTAKKATAKKATTKTTATKKATTKKTTTKKTTKKAR